ncbi:unnamed protein product [Schistosoma margrebowiei]|uniref:Neurotransmitter-gated ion-channel transmembrane domain-containing protein n=1 Tax=Schistosoma margrebowiei TaxID=48269 RepID=A0AA84Z6V1_9TREM|nr:unnamed protein product [Schistosoma margrebowiei]
MSINARSRLVQAFNDFGGRVSGEQILKFIKDDELLSRETRYSIKKLITSIAVVEYGSDKKRYLVLKDLARDKENLACNMCQSTQTTTSESSENQNVPKSTIISSQESQSTKLPVAHKTPPSSPQLVPTTAITTPATSVNVAAVRPSVYSTFTSNETRLWWMAVIDCRVADMKRLLGINPKLTNWATALHYAAKFGNINCLKLLINQYHANVNTRSRGRTPLHIAVVHSQRVVIRALVDDFKADPTLMDFSGYFPYMLLENNLKTEYEPFLTHGRLQRIRTALELAEKLQLSEFETPKQFITNDCSSGYSTSTGQYTCLNATFELQRQLGSYLATTYIPNVLIIMVSWLSFWVNVDSAPARVPLGLLSLLGILTQAISVSSTLPRVSYIKAIDIWMIFSIIFVIGVLVEYAIALTILRRKQSETWHEDVKEIVREELARWCAICQQQQLIQLQNSNHLTRGQLEFREELEHLLTNQFIDDHKDKTKPKRPPGLIESEIDTYSRFLFPACFVLYNCFYWCYFLIIVNQI